ncbi:MAG: diadenylate cyclase CdaA [Clostridia bacterium]|nr:diadenylate cyclase CdaA [Clostridia bacterium]
MGTINQWFENFFAVLRTFRVKDAIDIFAIGLILFYITKLVRETRAVQLVKGIFILLILYAAALLFNLTMMIALLNRFFEFAVIVLFIVFQPEIRKFLEQIGRSNYTYKRLKSLLFNAATDGDQLLIGQYLSIYVEAVMQLHEKKTGALIVFERRTRLGDIADTGTIINATPSIMMIGNVFFNKAPLHDGAMIVRDGKVYAAGCILPLTNDNKNVDDNLGTRHRAAIGVSEVSDAVVVVVSEETGSISIALNGEITRNYNRESLTKELNRLLIENEMDSAEKFSFRKGTKKEKSRREQ